jgi:thioredoxin
MKKTLIFSILLMMASATAFAQEQETKVQHITYQDFLKKIWDFEKNPDNFVFKGKTAVIVDFYANWCGPCRKVAPVMEKLAGEYDGKVTIYKVNVDEEKALASAFQVRSIPTMLFIPLEGKPMMTTGAYPEQEYRKIIDEQLLKTK